MTETRRVQLHLGKCIEDLDKLHNIPDLKTKRANLLCKTAQKLFESAEEARERGDEEYSYVYYMKYLRVIAYISKDKDYLKDKTYFNNMLGAKNPNKAIDAAEKLKNSLIDRYDKEQKIRRLNDIKENEVIKQKIEDNRKKAMEVVSIIEPPQPSPTTVELPDLEEVTISSSQLFALLKAGAHDVLILDARPAAEYRDSHINHSACVNVPEEIISPGQSANVLEQKLPAESRAAWARRGAASLVVLLDRASRAPIPGHTLHLLRTILLKWDIKVKYARPPLALQGGFEEWVLRYPALATNPRPARPAPAADDLHYLLHEIEYPAWSELSGAAPAPANSEPVVDRTSKAAAIQKYSERARTMQALLEQQERLADTSLTLEMQRVEAEQDWEKVHSQRAAERRREVRGVFALREQEILSQLMQLENKQYDMEQENQSLREQLEEYQRREKEEAAREAATLAHSAEEASRARLAARAAAAAAHIALVQQQKESLTATRARLEGARRARITQHADQQEEDGDAHMTSPSETGVLSRSHSSPNIAEAAVGAGGGTTGAAAPACDRSTKPAAPPDNRTRDFQPVWADVGRGLTGLKNLGNTCYMNSIIQCLNNTAILVTYFCNGQYLEHINRCHGTRGAVTEELAAVVRALWSGQYRFIAPKDLRSTVGRYGRAFRGSEQQDSHELLTILMDWLHLELQFAIKPPPQESLGASERAWHEYTRHKESLILRLFYGQIRSCVTCTVCGKQSLTYESFSNLSLEMPANSNRCTLSDCLKLYLTGESIPGWDCPACRDKRDAVKKLDISRLPPVLVIHFKRFYVEPQEVSTHAYRKKQTYIEFPLEQLDMRRFSLSAGRDPGRDPAEYSLYAVSNHYGTMEGGHYTAYCKSSVYGKWFKFDDHVVSEMSASEVRSSAAYILFYTSCRA